MNIMFYILTLIAVIVFYFTMSFLFEYIGMIVGKIGYKIKKNIQGEKKDE